MNSTSDSGHHTITARQHFFVRYFSFILIDLTVLNLFDEFWDLVQIPLFSISLLTAVLMQIMLKLTILVEHRVSHYFDAKAKNRKFLKYFSLWLVLFGSKFVILWAIDLAFGSQVLFLGPYHGIVSFIVVVVVILLAEALVVRFNRWLGL